MLHFQHDRLLDFPGKGDPIDSTDQLCVIGELVVAPEVGLDGDGDRRRVRRRGICRHLQPQTVVYNHPQAVCVLHIMFQGIL